MNKLFFILANLLIVTSSFAQNPFCELKEDLSYQKKFTQNQSSRALQELLFTPNNFILQNNDSVKLFVVNHPIIQKNFAQNPLCKVNFTLQFLYGLPTGVQEGYSLGDHTLRVLNVFVEQNQFFNLEKVSLSLPVAKSSQYLVWKTLILHDIGKPIAVAAGNKDHEEIFSINFSESILQNWQWNQSEIKIILTLIESHQEIGNYLRSKQSFNTLIHKIENDAEKLNIAPTDLFLMMRAVYISDAASYPWLRANIFHNTDQGLRPKSNLYQKLEEHFTKTLN